MVKIQPYNVTYLVSPLGKVQNLDKITFWYLKVLPHSTKALLPSLRKKFCSDLFLESDFSMVNSGHQHQKAAAVFKVELALLCILDSPWKKEQTKGQKGHSNWPSERQSSVLLSGLYHTLNQSVFMCVGIYTFSFTHPFGCSQM